MAACTRSSTVASGACSSGVVGNRSARRAGAAAGLGCGVEFREQRRLAGRPPGPPRSSRRQRPPRRRRTDPAPAPPPAAGARRPWTGRSTRPVQCAPGRCPWAGRSGAPRRRAGRGFRRRRSRRRSRRSSPFSVPFAAGGPGALEGPQEQRRQARVLLQRARPRRRRPPPRPAPGASAARPTTSHTFSRYSARPTSRPSAVSTARRLLKISRAGPMQANTRSAPRTPSPLQARHPGGDAPAGSSRSTSAQSPIGASGGTRAADQMDAGGQCGGLLRTQAPRPLRGDRPGADDRPAAADHAGEQRLPAFGGLVGKDHGTDRHPRAARGGPRRRRAPMTVLEERAVLDAAVAGPGLVLNRLAILGRQRVVGVEGIAQQRMIRATRA